MDSCSAQIESWYFGGCAGCCISGGGGCRNKRSRSRRGCRRLGWHGKRGEGSEERFCCACNSCLSDVGVSLRLFLQTEHASIIEEERINEKQQTNAKKDFHQKVQRNPIFFF